MLLYIIPTILILLCLAAIAYLVYKKAPSLALINVESISKEKETQVKNRIMTERLARRYNQVMSFLANVYQPLWEKIADLFESLYQKILELEKNLAPQPLKGIDTNQEIKEKLELANSLIAAQEYDQAEAVCISVVELNPRNLDVYELLTNIYLAEKEYKEARETCRYLLKLLTRAGKETELNGEKHRLANCYANLGWIYQMENKYSNALANFQKAVEIEPNNPRFLDLLLKACIILKNKKLAIKIINSLKEADPDNQKLPELKEQVDNLPSVSSGKEAA